MLLPLKLERREEEKGTAPYRACNAELAARVSKLAFSLSRLEVSDYFENASTRPNSVHSTSAFFSFFSPRARCLHFSIFFFPIVFTCVRTSLYITPTRFSSSFFVDLFRSSSSSSRTHNRSDSHSSHSSMIVSF